MFLDMNGLYPEINIVEEKTTMKREKTGKICDAVRAGAHLAEKIGEMIKNNRFDGFEQKDGNLILKHAAFDKRVSPRHFKDVIKKDRVKKYLDGEDLRKEVLYSFFDFIVNKKNINLYIFREDKFRGLDKGNLSSTGVKIL